MRKLSNGYLIFPHRGGPPKVPDGYEIVPGDKYVLRPKLPICENRRIVPPSSKCCSQADKMYCDIINRRIIRLTCAECQARPEWIRNR